jgi:multiple sugar transport system substrate-binding protein
MAKSEKSELGSKLTRREFLGTSLKIGLGAVGVAVAGVGCAPAATPQAAPATPTPQPAAPTAIPKEPVVLEYWQIEQGPNFAKVMDEAMKEFEDLYPNIRVNLSVAPYQEMNNRVFPVFTNGGPGPDIFMTGGVITTTLARMPYGYIDITDRVKASGMKDKIPPGVWPPMEDEGKVFGMPLDALPFMLTYNKDLYEAVGIAGPPETWEELLEVAKKIHDPSKDRFGFLAFSVWPAWPLEQLWYDSGVGYFEGSEDFRQYDITKPITITKPEAVEALEYLHSLAETAPGGLPGNIVDDGTADQVFAEGKLAHYFTHTIHTSQISDFNPAMVPGKNFDVEVFPKGPKRRGLLFTTAVYGISKLSKDPDAAWEFIKFLSDKWEGRLAPSIGNIPVRQDVEADKDAVGSWLLPVGREALAGDIFPQAYFPGVEAFAQVLRPNVEAYFLGKKTAKQALEDIAAEAERVLKG